MTEKICDLHTHSTYSDGTFTPIELIAEAERVGLSALALTDHNTVSGLPELLEAGKNSPVRVVPGCEFSTDYNGIELHVVGLFIAPSQFATVSSFLEDGVRRKLENTLQLIEALRGGGMQIDYEEIRAKTDGEINRAHIATALFEKGYADSVNDAFSKFLVPEKGYYKPIKRVSAVEAIGFIRSIGAVAVLAHPLLDLDELELCRFLPSAVDAGLCAIETDYTRFSPDKRIRLREIADSFGVLYSGGSDFHGARKPDVALATGSGDLLVPLSYLTALEQLAR